MKPSSSYDSRGFISKLCSAHIQMNLLMGPNPNKQEVTGLTESSRNPEKIAPRKSLFDFALSYYNDWQQHEWSLMKVPPCWLATRRAVPPTDEEDWQHPQRTEEEAAEESQHELSAPGDLSFSLLLSWLNISIFYSVKYADICVIYQAKTSVAFCILNIPWSLLSRLC